MAGCSSEVVPTNTPSPGDSAPTETPTPTDTPTPTVTPSATPTPLGPPTPLADINAITATGDFGKQPTVSAPYPFSVDKTDARALIVGTGPDVVADSIIELHYIGIDAATGVTFDSSFDRGTMLLTGQDGTFYSNASGQPSPMITGFSKSLMGQKSGSRVLMVITSADGYDPDGNSGAGINPGDTLIFVVDILASSVDAPTGTHLADGNQWVSVTDNGGKPTAQVIAGMAAPSDLQTTVLTQGTGRPVSADDAVYVNFLIQDYATGKTIENSYTGEGVATSDASSSGVSPQIDLLSNLIPGWRQALLGKPIGSRVLIIVPGNLAYPQGNATPTIAPNATLVCVVDVLFSFIPPQQTS